MRYTGNRAKLHPCVSILNPSPKRIFMIFLIAVIAVAVIAVVIIL